MKDGQKEVFLYVAGDHYNNGREGQDEQFKGRVSHFQDKLKHGDASIKIRNTKVTDSGDYTCDFLHRQPRQIFHIQLVVVEPNVIRVKEGSDVTLPCSLSSMEDIEYNFFIWRKDGQKEVFMYEGGFYYNNGHEGQDEQFKGRVSHFPDRLEHGDASIIIRNTKLTDSGDYTCAFPRLRPSQIFHIRLVVGAAAKPSVTILDQTNNWALLQCEVQGASPKPKVEWQDRAGNILPVEEPQVSERGGRYDIILQTTVTKTDRYRCVATQEDINHQIYAETYVYISGFWILPSGISTGLVVAVSALCTLLVAVAVVLLSWCYRRRRSTQNSRRGSPQETSIPLKEVSQTSRPQPSGQPPDPETEPALHVL